MAIVEKQYLINTYQGLSLFINTNALADSKIEKIFFERYGCRPLLPPMNPIF